jgi:hypothetical protein
MKTGRNQKINWQDYQTFKFKPSASPHNVECGASALHCITGKSFTEINKLSRRGHWPDSVMRSFLKKYNFTTIPVTLGSVVYSHSVKDDKPELSNYNVLLVSQKCYKEEGTWSVIHDYKYWHGGGEPVTFKPMEFLNYPLDSAYVVWHPKWACSMFNLPKEQAVKRRLYNLISSL